MCDWLLIQIHPPHLHRLGTFSFSTEFIKEKKTSWGHLLAVTYFCRADKTGGFHNQNQERLPLFGGNVHAYDTQPCIREGLKVWLQNKMKLEFLYFIILILPDKCPVFK